MGVKTSLEGWWTKEKFERMGQGKSRSDIVQALRHGEMPIEQAIIQGFAGEGDAAAVLADAIEMFDALYQRHVQLKEKEYANFQAIIDNAMQCIQKP